MRAWFPSAVAAMAFAAGCGSGEEGEVESAVKGLYDSLAERDPAGVCESLTTARRRELSGGGRTCPATIRVAMGLIGPRLRRVGDAEVEKVEIDGARATATVHSGGRSGRLGLAKEAGDWKVADFALDQL